MKKLSRYYKLDLMFRNPINWNEFFNEMKVSNQT